MRSIKFRAWDTEHNTGMFYPLEWFFGNVVKAKHPAGKTIEVIPMQFTGLTDRNGVEIYEGDIVRIYKHMGNEESEVNRVGWDGKRLTYSGIYPSISVWSQHEVIGNVYENPELLKAQGEHGQVTLADIASPNPSAEASAVIDRAVTVSHKDMRRKAELSEAVEKVVEQYGETLKRLGES